MSGRIPARKLALTLLAVAAEVSLAADRPFIFAGRNARDVVPSETAAAASSSMVGSTVDRASAGTESSRSWPATIGENFGTPMFYDLNGDGIMEVIAVDRQRTYVFDAQGSLLPGWPATTGEVNNTPAVADIDEDGSPEIFVTSAGAPPRIHCLHLDGTEQAGFPVNLPYQNWLNVSAPAVADIDGDGHLDVGAQSEPGVAFFDRVGHPLPGWPYLWSTGQNIVWSAPAVADLDGDGRNEVAVGNNNLYNCAVHVIRSDGTAMPGWPRPTQNIFSSPAVGDLDGDGRLEVVIQEGDATWYGAQMHVWRYDGTYLPGWPRSISGDWESSRSNPAIADLDNNGTLEIVTATSDAKLHILRADGTEFPGYPRALPGGAISSAQVVDVDGDGVEEIFLCYWANGSQWVSGWKLNGITLTGFPKVLYSGSQLEAHSSIHLADLEGDGDFDLCAQGGTFGAGRVCVYEVDGSNYHPGINRVDWPKIRCGLTNTGHYPQSDPAGVEGIAVAAGRLSCSPNPVVMGQSIRVQLPGHDPGRLLIFDPSGRRAGEVEAQGGTTVTFETRMLFEEKAIAGGYFLRWAPSSAARKSSAGCSSGRLIVLHR